MTAPKTSTQLRRRAWICLAFYVAFKLASFLWLWKVGDHLPRDVQVFWLLFFTGSAFAFSACWALARAKGRSGKLALLAFLGFVGFGIVALLPDRSLGEEARRS